MDKIKRTKTYIRHKEKRCYGTKEPLNNNSICKYCKWRKDCLKVKPKLEWGNRGK